ncbi:MAG: DUF3429 domain-containing protein [Rhizobiales bacterium]|nr:DUF3429 domain-containing protein [Hyphomicrobiales bacterium]
MSVAYAETRIPGAAWLAGLIAVLPLAASIAALWVPERGFDTLARQAGPIYAALLITFFSGIRWGAVLSAISTPELLLGLIPPYAAWIALILRPEFALCILLIVLLLQALADVLAVEEGHLPYWYGKWRMLLTAAAGIAILAMLGERLFH